MDPVKFDAKFKGWRTVTGGNNSDVNSMLANWISDFHWWLWSSCCLLTQSPIVIFCCFNLPRLITSQQESLREVPSQREETENMKDRQHFAIVWPWPCDWCLSDEVHCSMQRWDVLWLSMSMLLAKRQQWCHPVWWKTLNFPATTTPLLCCDRQHIKGSHIYYLKWCLSSHWTHNITSPMLLCRALTSGNRGAPSSVLLAFTLCWACWDEPGSWWHFRLETPCLGSIWGVQQASFGAEIRFDRPLNAMKLAVCLTVTRTMQTINRWVWMAVFPYLESQAKC